MHKIGGAHLQCVNNHYATFDYKESKTIGVKDYTNQTPSKHFEQKNVQAQPPKNEKIVIICAINRRCTFSMCEQALYEV